MNLLLTQRQAALPRGCAMLCSCWQRPFHAIAVRMPARSIAARSSMLKHSIAHSTFSSGSSCSSSSRRLLQPRRVAAAVRSVDAASVDADGPDSIPPEAQVGNARLHTCCESKYNRRKAVRGQKEETKYQAAPRAPKWQCIVASLTVEVTYVRMKKCHRKCNVSVSFLSSGSLHECVIACLHCCWWLQVFLDKKDFSLSQLLSMVRDGDLDLQPQYQRGLVWDTKMASRCERASLVACAQVSCL